MKVMKWKKWEPRQQRQEDQAITQHLSETTVLRAACAIPGQCEFQVGKFLQQPKWNSQNGRIKMEMAEVPRSSLKIHTLLISQSVFGKLQSAMLRFIMFSL